MNKDIKWHKECLANSKASLDRKRKALKALEVEVGLCARSCNLYSAQISLAEKEGKDGFDRDKYAIRRLCV